MGYFVGSLWAGEGGWMISLPMALRLKEAGLVWTPKLHDFFAIPERGMDARVFVISDLQTNIEKLFGSEVVAFQGASEWALDYLVASEAVWMPREDQLREALIDRLQEPNLSIYFYQQRCHLKIKSGPVILTYNAQNAEDAYGQALLQVLVRPAPGNGAPPEG
jgi:hypothetical protein